ncbi:hypothetical protein WJ0W_005716 [Paenibacillus melissococcoides]|uniref:Uncharacterized protein n=1 Tax=Paenibacillus melissococcoides TaxID=2912268 RepID=A0ABM9G9T0_9BACL|nr:hypothetical protein [Paenibacillus melissococcoides]CAH8248534.1 hypothetical protein WJ0W_005716 [Paenibacillus melissococcoides]
MSSKAEAAAIFGYSTDFESYTLHEAMESHFTLYKQREAILVNVMDVSEAKKSNTATIDLSKSVTETSILYPILESVTLKGAAELEKGKDYEVELDNEGYLVITIPEGSAVKLPATGLTLTCDMPDVSKVKPADIIGGIQGDTRTGLELLDAMMPLLGDIPKLVLAPKFSADPTVADAMAAKAQGINGIFKAVTLVDIDTTAAKTIAAAIDGKKGERPGRIYVLAEGGPQWPAVPHEHARRGHHWSNGLGQWRYSYGVAVESPDGGGRLRIGRWHANAFGVRAGQQAQCPGHRDGDAFLLTASCCGVIGHQLTRTTKT